MSKIVIIGGGAAGLLCAAKSAEKGNDVVIIEKMNRCGRKLNQNRILLSVSL